MNMADQDTGSTDIKALEERVDDLIETVNKLSSENTALRSQQNNLTAERAELIEKTERAKSRIESMILRLRAMEIRS